jgi:tetratricopeptide (TPR) repeat protein
MYNIIPLIVILLSLGVILVIVFKKLPLLASFDVSSIPKEKEAETREKIIEERIKRKAKYIWEKVSPFLKTFGNIFLRKFQASQEKLKKFEEKHKSKPKKEILVTKTEFEDYEKKLTGLLQTAADLVNKEAWADAEKKYIEIISLEPKNIEAFRGLGNLYFLQKNYDESKQTYEHILKLNKQDDQAYAYLGKIAEEKGDFDQAKQDYLQSLNISNSALHHFELAEVCQKMGDFDEAVNNLEKALVSEPNNPKYLDLLLEISIIIKNKALAKEVLKQLKDANPDNGKIPEFEAKIRQL